MKSTTIFGLAAACFFLLTGSFTLQAQNCSDLNEPNNNYLQATPITPGNNDHGLINPSGDIDVFSFTVTQDAPNLRIVLSNLPTNYDLKLYQSNGQAAGTSKHRGKTNDTIVKNNATPGIYYARVFGNNGKFDADHCYVIKVNTSNVPYKLAEENTQPGTGFTVEAYPNPATSFVTILTNGNPTGAVLSVYDLSGRKVISDISLSSDAAKEARLDVSALPASTYLVRIASVNGIVVTKLQVQR